jgi:protoheme IX farnesyltransferase
MLPVVADAVTVSRRILGYSVAMVSASLALIPATGWVYGAGAAALGAAFLLAAARLHGRVRAGAKPDSLRLFHHSISYLTLLFVLVAVAPFVP